MCPVGSGDHDIQFFKSSLGVLKLRGSDIFWNKYFDSLLIALQTCLPCNEKMGTSSLSENESVGSDNESVGSDNSILFEEDNNQHKPEKVTPFAASDAVTQPSHYMVP